jgi:hypothetical protein
MITPTLSVVFFADSMCHAQRIVSIRDHHVEWVKPLLKVKHALQVPEKDEKKAEHFARLSSEREENLETPQSRGGWLPRVLCWGCGSLTETISSAWDLSEVRDHILSLSPHHAADHLANEADEDCEWSRDNIASHLVGFASKNFGHHHPTMTSMCGQNLVCPACCFVMEPDTGWADGQPAEEIKSSLDHCGAICTAPWLSVCVSVGSSWTNPMSDDRDRKDKAQIFQHQPCWQIPPFVGSH